MKQICVFCGSRAGTRPEYAQAARSVGVALGRRGLGLVYGGGAVGLMAVVADAALAAGAEVTGVITSLQLERPELAHAGLTRLEAVTSLAERKARMAELADAFIALPGGLGTLDELFEMATWTQLGLQAKPCGLLDAAGYFDPLRGLLDRAVDDGLLGPEYRPIVLHATEIDQLLDALERWTAPNTRKWVGGALV